MRKRLERAGYTVTLHLSGWFVATNYVEGKPTIKADTLGGLVKLAFG